MSRKFDDPPRMTGLDEVPDGLRTLLRQATNDVLPATQLEQLVGSFERRIANGELTTSNIRPVAASPRRTSGAHRVRLRLTTFPRRLSLTLAVLGVSAVFGTAVFMRTKEREPRASMPNGEPSAVEAPRVIPSSPSREFGNLEAEAPGERSRGVTSNRAVPEAQPAPPNTTIDPPSIVRKTGAVPARTLSVDLNADGTNEYPLVRAARQAVTADPARALALTNEHLRRFPNGMLGQERETLAIEALARLGERAAAQKRAERFLAEYPNSPYVSRIQSALGIAPHSVTP